jgi:PAS domain S-box-containing protein
MRRSLKALWDRSYSRRIGFTLAFCFGGILGIPQYLTYHGEGQRLVSSVMEQASGSVETVLPRIVEAVHYGQYFELWKELSRITDVSRRRADKGALLDIRDMVVLDNSGAVLGHSAPDRHPLLLPYTDTLFNPEMLGQGWSTRWDDDRALIVVNAPMDWDGQRVGLLQVAYATANLQSRLQSAKNSLLLSLALAAIVAFALSAIIARWATEPLRFLTPVLGKIGEGEVALTPYAERRDEFGELARALEMADTRIHASSRALKREIEARHGVQAVLSAFKTTLDMTRDCVFMFEPDSLRFFYVNEGAIKQVGFSEAELFRMKPFDIKPEFDDHRFRNLIAPLLRGEQRYLHFETVHCHKDGHHVPVEIMLQYIEADEISARFVAIVRDVTERRKVQRELEQHNERLEELVKRRTEGLHSALDAAEQASRAKTEFLSRMSHELRTPMNAILGFAQLMRTDVHDPLSPAHQENVDEILDAGDHLLTLINEVLDLGRIEAGRVDIEPRVVRFADVVHASLKMIETQANSRGVTVVDATHECNAHVFADFVRLRQVVINLLSNAVKYNREGGSVTLSCRAAGTRVVRLEVIDTGIGIREEDIARLFTPFERLDAGSEVEGTGVGLVICRRLLELMGGTLTVTSCHGKGSTFSIELPLCAENAQMEVAT